MFPLSSISMLWLELATERKAELETILCGYDAEISQAADVSLPLLFFVS